ncbi:MAG: hypothetical protein KDB60_13345, partial [Propionibacteriaceae bacterium]|nr:hypothetical protein [Propionibacteriaceae bacterium]
RRQLILAAAAISSMIVLAFAIPLGALVRTLAEDVERILDDTIEALERWGDNAGASAHAVADAAHRADE